MFESLHPWTSFDIRWLDVFIIVINQVEKATPLFIRCLECYFPMTDDVVAIALAIIPWNTTWKHRLRIKWFRILINCLMKSPVEMTRTFPKFDRVVLIFSEESTQFLKNRSHMELIWMGTVFKDFLSSMYWVSNDDYLGNIISAACLIDTASNSKKLCFSTCDVHGMMDRLYQRMVVYMYMGYRCSNVVFDASICYNNGWIGWRQ